MIVLFEFAGHAVQLPCPTVDLKKETAHGVHAFVSYPAKHKQFAADALPGWLIERVGHACGVAVAAGQ